MSTTLSRKQVLIQRIATTIIYLLAFFILTSCTYLKYSSIQAEYARIQNADPSQVNLKHMLDQETFFVFGKTIDKSTRYKGVSMAIVAYSSKFKQNERVDTMFFKASGTHYGLNLPEGAYTLLVYADTDKDQRLDRSEVVGKREVVLNPATYPEKIMGHIDIELSKTLTVHWAETIPLPDIRKKVQSLYYPTGTIRRLDDPIFDNNIATLGMYDPAAFLEHSSTMFYALEEEVAHKIPVVFVHGIGGNPRSFESIIKRMDLNRYKLWFYYYPSGGDLQQLADFFYRLFLSGEIITLAEMPMIVVAHSMGGIVVREAINKYKRTKNENTVELFVTIASPLGGHPAAASGEEHGLIVLPAWRDLNPQNSFMKELYRKPLPKFVSHQLFYAFKNSSTIKLSENSDGTVPLFSQLHPEAQEQSADQFGFNSGHVDILQNEEMIIRLLDKMNAINSFFPESHMKILAKGGFDVNLGDNYSPFSQHLIQYAGKYIVFLLNGDIEPFYPEQDHFVQAIQGKVPATNDLERDFIMLLKEHPDIFNGAVKDPVKKQQ